MKALRLPEARSPLGEILNYPYPNPRRVISLSPGGRGRRAPNCSFFNKARIARDVESRPRAERERDGETPDLNISTRARNLCPRRSSRNGLK